MSSIDKAIKEIIAFEDMINSSEWQASIKPAEYKREVNNEHKEINN